MHRSLVLDRRHMTVRELPQSVLIVGGRATGTAALVHLAARVPAGSTITVVDPADPRYPAVFDDPHPLLLANTSAGVNSLFPELPGDFARFAHCSPEGVVPRAVVGRYCAHRFHAAVEQAAEHDVSVRRITASCRSIATTSGGQYEASLSNRQRVRVTDVVIAVGMGPVQRSHGLTGIAPFPSTRLQRRASSHALVVGQGQSAIDAALVLCAMGSRVVMTSRTGWFPSVRTRTLPHPVRPGAVDDPPDLRDLVNHDCLAKGFPPLDCQFSHTADPVRRLREEIELAETDACPWQDSIVGVLDLLAAQRLYVAKDKEFAWRHVNAILLPTAQRLLALLGTGQILVEDIDSTDPTRFDLVVTATGFAPPPLHHTNHALFFRDPPARSRPLDQLSPELQVSLTPERAPERIWAIGPASWPRAPFANFLRIAATQAEWVARQITQRPQPHLTPGALHPVAGSTCSSNPQHQ